MSSPRSYHSTLSARRSDKSERRGQKRARDWPSEPRDKRTIQPQWTFATPRHGERVCLPYGTLTGHIVLWEDIDGIVVPEHRIAHPRVFDQEQQHFFLDDRDLIDAHYQPRKGDRITFSVYEDSQGIGCHSVNHIADKSSRRGHPVDVMPHRRNRSIDENDSRRDHAYRSESSNKDRSLRRGHPVDAMPRRRNRSIDEKHSRRDHAYPSESSNKGALGVQILMDSHYVGKFIGTKGTHVTKCKKESGLKVLSALKEKVYDQHKMEVSKRVILMSGELEQIKEGILIYARFISEATQNEKSHIEWLCSGKTAGRFIGKRGSHIKGMRESFPELSIKVQPDRLTIEGEEEDEKSIATVFGPLEEIEKFIDYITEYFIRD